MADADGRLQSPRRRSSSQYSARSRRGAGALGRRRAGWKPWASPIEQTFHWAKKDIQVAFPLLVLAETWPVPFEGALIDHVGPRAVVLVGGFLVGLAWVMNSMVSSLAGPYMAATIGGLGAGAD